VPSRIQVLSHPNIVVFCSPTKMAFSCLSLLPSDLLTKYMICMRKDKPMSHNNSFQRVNSVLTWVPTHLLSNFYLKHINPFLVCFPSRAQDSGVQKWF
jgi:hypothetical protein